MEEMKDVPYIVLESAEARSERTIKRLIAALVLAIVCFLFTNLAWMYMWNQYEYVAETETRIYTQDGQGLNIIGDDNEVTDGSERSNNP